MSYSLAERLASISINSLCEDEHGTLHAVIDAIRLELKPMETELSRLRAFVDKLQKTADGVTVVPGMDVWLLEPSVRCVWVIGINPSGVIDVSFHGVQDASVTAALDAYSTREAAEAARERNNV